MPVRIASRARRGDRPDPGSSESAGTLKEESRMQPIDSATLANKDYVAEQYRRYKADPRSVGEEWALFFAGFELGASGNGAVVGAAVAGAPPAAATGPPVIGVFDLVHSYRELGHLVADLNPLAPKPAGHPLLEPSEFGFGDEDLDRVVSCGGFRGCSRTSIRDLIARLQATYCGTLGVEYMHIQDQEQRVWLQERMETTSNHPDLSPEDRLRVLDSLIVAEGLEQFLQLRYPTAKRFSLEGSDSLVPFLHTLIEDAGSLGVEEMVFGMPHRGRINVLANVLRKPYEMIIAEFEGSLLAKEATGDGDVKYHLGYSRDHTTRAGRKVHLSLAANPSHLEAIDPIIEGMVRAKQQHLHDAEYARVVPVLMHGDASFTGQGVVAETLGLSELDGYRRHGHNELDDPTFTQPVMYKKIAAKRTPLTLYREQLVQAGVVAAEEAERRAREFRELLDDAQSYARDFMPRQPVFAFGGLWKGLGWAGDDWSARTAVAPEVLHEIAAAFTRMPEGFTPHPRAARLMETRAQMVREGRGIDWSCAEALAIGALLLEGIPVRMSGQDTCRGTFSQRHAVLHDVNTDDQYVPLDNIRGDQAPFRVIDSMLSENAVLGFELGMSLADPSRLVLWEAQFGDFINGAQVVVDQFLASSESKWQRMSGLVLLLPHGYEGQGPEHSSARLERFLQLCAEDNMQVCNLTTPAQYFHALRRQMHRNFRKPFVLMSPKSLLRHKLCVSPLEELTQGGFRTVIDDIALGGAPEAGVTIERGGARRILLWSGKIYYELLAGRRERAIDSAALVRGEQPYPFPATELEAIFAAYPEARQVYWVQEEPWNMGAWHVMYRRLRRILPEERSLHYAGRPEAASPATGSFKLHLAEERDLVNAALAR